MNDTVKAILIVLSLCITIYISFFVLWNETGPSDRKPSSYFWDSHRDGFKEDPLYDRKGNE